MAAFLHLCWCLALSVVLLLGPGLLVSRVLSARPEAGEPPLRWLLAVAWGAGVVPTLAFFCYLAFGLRVALPTLVLAALAHYLLAWLVDSKRRGRGLASGLSWWLEGLDLRAHAALLLSSLAVGLLYFLRYSDVALAPDNSCIFSTALTALGEKDAHLHLLTENVEDARLGNTGVIAGYLGLFGATGYRLLHATCGLLLALSGAAMGARFGPSQRWWVAGLLLLSLNPYVLSLSQPDENLLALCWLAPSLLLLLLRRPQWLLAGVLLGLALSMRHVLILGLPAVLVLLWGASERQRAAVHLGGGLLLSTLFEHLHHALALGSVFRFESNAQFEPSLYSIFGMDFRWEGLLNWPLHEVVVRTPHVPLPTFARWPLHLADHFGTLLLALMLVGAIAQLRHSRRDALFMLLWLVPVYALLSLQESWDFPNKMGVLLIVLPSLVAWMLAGTSALLERPRLAAAGLVVALIFVHAGLLQLRSVQAPVDARYIEQFSETPPESTALLELERKRISSFGLLPDYGRTRDAGPLLDPQLGRSLADLLAGRIGKAELRPWGWHRGELPQPGAPVTLEIDLSMLAAQGRVQVQRTDEPADLDLSGPLHPLVLHRARGLEGGEGLGPLLAYAWRGPEVTTLALAMERPDDTSGPLCACSWADGEFEPPCDGRCSVLTEATGLDVLDGTGAPLAPETLLLSGSRLRVRLPAGGLSILQLELPLANRFLLWRVLVSPADVQVDGPWRPWHS